MLLISNIIIVIVIVALTLVTLGIDSASGQLCQFDATSHIQTIM